MATSASFGGGGGAPPAAGGASPCPCLSLRSVRACCEQAPRPALAPGVLREHAMVLLARLQHFALSLPERREALAAFAAAENRARVPGGGDGALLRRGGAASRRLLSGALERFLEFLCFEYPSYRHRSTMVDLFARRHARALEAAPRSALAALVASRAALLRVTPGGDSIWPRALVVSDGFERRGWLLVGPLREPFSLAPRPGDALLGRLMPHGALALVGPGALPIPASVLESFRARVSAEASQAGLSCPAWIARFPIRARVLARRVGAGEAVAASATAASEVA